ncbi:hypothetical protein ANN_13920 [Periplaneta americana]|uniref:Uncharacterized protein n=1 Tax=Periplaneta americana TaxID=6978 RepID=A0ABQ8SUV5_PERAM|nr:hypothetical protein ANN_13920 [Periplaneta americana]
MKNRKLRLEEEAYLSYKRSKDGKVTHDMERDARNLGPDCSYKMCQNSKAFWKTMTWEQRIVYVSNLVDFTPTKRPGSTNSESRRKRAFVYNLKVDEKKFSYAVLVLKRRYKKIHIDSSRKEVAKYIKNDVDNSHEVGGGSTERYPGSRNPGHPEYGKSRSSSTNDPVFDNNLVTNVTAQLGGTAFLHCRVRNLGERPLDKRILAVVCNGTKAASTQFNIPIAYACNLGRILKESSLKVPQIFYRRLCCWAIVPTVILPPVFFDGIEGTNSSSTLWRSVKFYACVISWSKASASKDFRYDRLTEKPSIVHAHI